MNEKKEELIKYLKSVEKVSLKQIYENFPDWSKDGIRGMIVFQQLL